MFMQTFKTSAYDYTVLYAGRRKGCQSYVARTGRGEIHMHNGSWEVRVYPHKEG